MKKIFLSIILLISLDFSAIQGTPYFDKWGQRPLKKKDIGNSYGTCCTILLIQSMTCRGESFFQYEIRDN